VDYIDLGHIRIPIPSGRTPTDNTATTEFVPASTTVTIPDVVFDAIYTCPKHARFAFELREPLRIASEDVGQDLDGDVAAQPQVSRAIDLAHAAGTETPDDLVRADSLSFEGQRW
jgi:hypothetical protein